MFLENQDLVIYVLSFLVFVLLIWNLAQQLALSGIRKQQAIFLQGKNAQNLEQVILKNQKAWSSAKNDIRDLYKITTRVHDLAFLGLHKVGMVRFNPFRDIGGDQSFSIALLDGKNNGLVLSSMYSREGVRVYTKSIIQGDSEKHQLTEEEKKAISIASATKIQIKKN